MDTFEYPAEVVYARAEESRKLREQVDQVRKLHSLDTITGVTCPIECDEHVDECPDDRPIHVCGHCWAGADQDDEIIDSAVLWPCDTARLVHSDAEIAAATQETP